MAIFHQPFEQCSFGIAPLFSILIAVCPDKLACNHQSHRKGFREAGTRMEKLEARAHLNQPTIKRPKSAA
jgi:hypothetical protein